MKCLPYILISMIVFSLCIPAQTHAVRPPKKESPFVTDIIRKARDLEKSGRSDEAEETLLGLYRGYEGKRFREESDWLAYMNILRSIVSFYYRQGEFKEADWYLREYSNELDDDEDESGMHAMIVYDIMEIAGALIDEGKHPRAEETFLYLMDSLEDRFGYEHWLVRLVYKNIVSLYLRMGNEEKAMEFNRKLNPESE